MPQEDVTKFAKKYFKSHFEAAADEDYEQEDEEGPKLDQFQSVLSYLEETGAQESQFMYGLLNSLIEEETHAIQEHLPTVMQGVLSQKGKWKILHGIN